ncbi:hypothetical protein CIP107550_00225 [Corynebacterium diphtheriae]|nr:hypothetical protein CIP107550_00225 [Corynebacterium diphtheriae]
MPGFAYSYLSDLWLFIGVTIWCFTGVIELEDFIFLASIKAINRLLDNKLALLSFWLIGVGVCNLDLEFRGAVLVKAY